MFLLNLLIEKYQIGIWNRNKIYAACFRVNFSMLPLELYSIKQL